MKLWGCEVVSLRGFQAVSLHCEAVMCEALRLGGCEAERLSAVRL